VHKALLHLFSSILFLSCSLVPYEEMLNEEQCLDVTSLLTEKRLHKSFLHQQERKQAWIYLHRQTQLESLQELQDSCFQNETEEMKTCFSPRSKRNYLLSILPQQPKAQLEKSRKKFPLSSH